MNFPAIFNSSSSEGILKSPGDMMIAKITPTGRQVVKIVTENGRNRYSATKYHTGTVVETKSRKG